MTAPLVLLRIPWNLLTCNHFELKLWDWSKYKESRDTIKEILRETERNYTFLEVQQNKSNPSSLWKVINRVIPSKNKEPQRVYTKDLKTVTDEFNVFFTSVGKTAALPTSHLAEINNITWSEQQLASLPAGDLFDFKRVLCEEVRHIISSLPLNKSPGPDKIHTWVYRDCLPVILGPLTEIINSSLESAKYPGSIPSCQIACLSPTESLRGKFSHHCYFAFI